MCKAVSPKLSCHQPAMLVQAVAAWRRFSLPCKSRAQMASAQGVLAQSDVFHADYQYTRSKSSSVVPYLLLCSRDWVFFHLVSIYQLPQSFCQHNMSFKQRSTPLLLINSLPFADALSAQLGSCVCALDRAALRAGPTGRMAPVAKILQQESKQNTYGKYAAYSPKSL